MSTGNLRSSPRLRRFSADPYQGRWPAQTVIEFYIEPTDAPEDGAGTTIALTVDEARLIGRRLLAVAQDTPPSRDQE